MTSSSLHHLAPAQTGSAGPAVKKMTRPAAPAFAPGSRCSPGG